MLHANTSAYSVLNDTEFEEFEEIRCKEATVACCFFNRAGTTFPVSIRSEGGG